MRLVFLCLFAAQGAFTALVVFVGVIHARRQRDPFEEWLARIHEGDVFITPRGTEIPVGRLSASELVEFFADIESLPETKEVVL